MVAKSGSSSSGPLRDRRLAYPMPAQARFTSSRCHSLCQYLVVMLSRFYTRSPFASRRLPSHQTLTLPKRELRLLQMDDALPLSGQLPSGKSHVMLTKSV